MVDPLKYFAIADARVSPPSNKQLGITLPEKTDYTLKVMVEMPSDGSTVGTPRFVLGSGGRLQTHAYARSLI